jgi:hypothetical protein
MTHEEIEHMWKVASNNPNHDTNWHDPVIVAFAKLVGAHTLMNIDPSKFMSHQEGIEAGRFAEREACAQAAAIALLGADRELAERVVRAIRARGQA